MENGNAWGGTTMRYTGPGVESYRTVASELHASGHGSSALVHIEWPLRANGQLTSHVFTALNHNGQIYWLDPQSGEVSITPINSKAVHTYHYVLDSRRHPVTPHAPAIVSTVP